MSGRDSHGSGTYLPDRVRQLRALVWVLLAMASLLVGYAVLLLVDGSADEGSVLRLLVLPALLLLALGAFSLRLLADNGPPVRSALATTGLVAIWLGLVLSRLGPGFLFSVVGILVVLVALLPGREES